LLVDLGLFGCERCFGPRVRGDSMIGVNIANGDIAIIRYPQLDEVNPLFVQYCLCEHAFYKILS
jgi:hypothetical protein